MRMGIFVLTLCALTPVMAAEVAGTVQWSRRVELGTPVSGVVTRVFVEPGQRVVKGQPMVQLDDRRYRVQLAKAQANVARLARERDEAKREQERAQQLYERNLLSNHELEVQKIAFAGAESRYQVAKASLSEARLDVEYSTLRAPFDAWVLEVHAEVGQAVVNKLAAVPLITVAESGRVLVRSLVTEAQMQALGTGREVSVVAGGRRYSGAIKRVGLEPIAGAPVQYPLDVIINPREAVLRAGQKAWVILP